MSIDFVSDLPLISVVVPAYNHEKYIGAALSSLIAQTYPNIELLVIDDGSSDKTWSIIQSMDGACRQRFIRTSLATQRNKGVSATLDALIQNAIGSYIYYLGSDDAAEPEAIETLYNSLSQNPGYVLAVGDSLFIDGQDRPLVCIDQSVENGVAVTRTYGKFSELAAAKMSHIDIRSANFGNYASLLMGNYIPNGYMMRANAVKSVRLVAGFALEDFYLHLQLAKMGKMKYIDRILLKNRRHEENVSRDNERLQKLATDTFWLEVKIIQQSGNEEMINFINKYIEFLKRKTAQTS